MIDINLAQYDLIEKDISQAREDIFFVEKEKWDYQKAWDFQKRAVELVGQNPRLKIYIFCSHSEVLTYGRGLQKPRKGESFDLIDQKPSEMHNLPFPLYQIERGGGLTFHHPGQVIFYPIRMLNPKTLSLSSMVDDMLLFSQEILESHGLDNLTYQRSLLGLWRENRKLASVGIAIKRLVTYHGLALNLSLQNELLSSLAKLNPCGLEIGTYSSVQNELNRKVPREDFISQFKERIIHAW